MKSLINMLGSETPQQNISKQSCKQKTFRKDSILESIETGFGSGNFLLKDCPDTKFKIPLFKEDYLSDFVSETEKRLVRSNLGLVGVSEVTEIVDGLVKEKVESFITIEKAEELISQLDMVDAKLNSNADYKIPDKLFKL